MNALERRYRRLLAWYPKEHRAEHEAEMLAVLLAGSLPGQTRPSVRDTLDLVRGGLSIRLRRTIKPESRGHWVDALNLAALIGPIILLLMELSRAAGVTEEVLRGFSPPEDVLKAMAYVAPYGLIAVLAWLGRAKVAAVCAWAWLAFYVWLIISPDAGLSRFVVMDSGTTVLLATAPWAFPGCVVAAMLTLAPSPGPAPLGTRRLLAWAAVFLATMVLGVRFAPVGGLLIYALLIVTLATALRSPIGRRAAIVLVPWLTAEIGLIRAAWVVPAIAAFTAAALAFMSWQARVGRAPAASDRGRD
ncbi:hypothetical protein Pth03_22850 [Planotetraspora thailandica]|uniref:Uncharacterized protein n=1 Tax=Planotetraspora thailandica TaxID=487172 RepID=A0A8J3V2N8_9ACTN|nr:hypothetical protein [Planotetraspora thailandica]GII53896.1 hypothetical protein Pth03_22850 [Planotetraspora thailandica]